MLVHYIQHVPFEGLGCIESWLLEHGHSLQAIRLYESPDLPSPESIEALIVMGGPMGVNDTDLYPWLSAEKELIRAIIEAGKPVLGICLGAQLIASALGAPVTRNPHKEIGWWPIKSIDYGDNTTFRFPETSTVFHWHGDTFAIPQTARLIASSEACTHQAFQLGDKVIGLQFHLETTPTSLAGMLEHCRDDITSGNFVQCEETILSLSETNIPASNHILDHLLTYLLS